MDKFTLTINLDRISEDHIWKNKDGERCISANLVENRKTWSNGDETWGFVAQWWKDETLPAGQYPEHPILGNAKKFEKRPEEAAPEQPKSTGSPF